MDDDHGAFLAGAHEGRLTTDEVLEILKENGVSDAALAVFPRRMEPSGEHPGDKVFRVPVATARGRYMTASFSFGQSDADEARNWEPVWHEVAGPFTRQELEAGG